MLYLFVKTLHILAVVIWIGSLFLLTLITCKENLTTAQLKAATRITEAGIGFTWLAGIVLVVLGSWHLAGWWQIKIVLVVIISAIHSIVHRRWKRQAGADQQTNAAIPWCVFVLSMCAIGLAVFKLP